MGAYMTILAGLFSPPSRWIHRRGLRLVIGPIDILNATAAFILTDEPHNFILSSIRVAYVAPPTGVLTSPSFR